ncbi:type 2 isopentenyl-diphosphate Delta-isomerase [Candidatus Micrarchaeota archaeon]|nr:type 2 isopentenyl-diphosphate Delta-isomerase [Candidatus Micrarchaeota archaeon]
MTKIADRKAQHVDIVLNKDIDFKNKKTGFNDIDFLYYALPEMNFNEVSLKTSFLKHSFQAPLLISSMTGGYAEGEKINQELAIAAEAEGIPMGFGSMRPMLKHSELAKTFMVRKHAPKAVLYGNFGAAQLLEYTPKQVCDAVEKIEANGCFIHINALQETVQPEGDRNWVGVLKAISKLCDYAKFPIIAKEVGAGINGFVARELQEAGVSAVDVAGAGGTSWTAIEIYRKGAKEGNLFWDFGVPTLTALQQCSASTSLPLIASGGLRNGLDCAKAIRFGASLCGVAKPFIQAQNKGGVKAIREEIQSFKKGLQIAMFLTRSKNLTQLKKAKMLENG